jgi:hypothetical protein
MSACSGPISLKAIVGCPEYFADVETSGFINNPWFEAKKASFCYGFPMSCHQAKFGATFLICPRL